MKSKFIRNKKRVPLFRGIEVAPIPIVRSLPTVIITEANRERLRSEFGLSDHEIDSIEKGVKQWLPYTGLNLPLRNVVDAAKKGLLQAISDLSSQLKQLNPAINELLNLTTNIPKHQRFDTHKQTIFQELDAVKEIVDMQLPLDRFKVRENALPSELEYIVAVVVHVLETKSEMGQILKGQSDEHDLVPSLRSDEFLSIVGIVFETIHLNGKASATTFCGDHDNWSKIQKLVPRMGTLDNISLDVHAAGNR